MGIQPDILVLRTEHHLDDALRLKMASFCNVSLECVVQSEDMAGIYSGVKVKPHFVSSEDITEENVAEKLDCYGRCRPFRHHFL